ncbi:alpha/beta fold hydrolase [Coraliomargarita algicola]|uniref:Alpha/beta fold hydrolase n=1 Tax=Coraliomargarita algicola TaxID=3092156 RepID=A0ABZ0RRM6_9BACT|nr:GDSL-type esterase/lipase family protein [Coraliomargarita sp. J2-16]WPJ97983.1 alpha/beta fold hydrolase [Coraliomargarita sp. J2-16]
MKKITSLLCAALACIPLLTMASDPKMNLTQNKTELAAAPLPQSSEAAQKFPGEVQDWHGFEMVVHEDTRIVIPHQEADGKPWVWRARFWGHEPQFDIAMLERGYHVVYCDVSGLYGSPEAVARWNAFYNYLRFEHLFADRAVLEGMSRGGLIVYNWAAANPDKVAAIYADAPVMDFKSWPGINDAILARYGFKDQAEATAYTGNPIDNLAPLAKAGIPILHVVGDADEVVPVAENTAIAEARYHTMGGTFKVIHKPDAGHHPHSLEDPQPIVDFIIQHSQGQGDLAADQIVSDKNFILRSDFQNSRIQFEQQRRGHVAFIGGSITEMNGYRPMLCEMLEARFPETAFTFTDAGISSTCSDTGAFRLEQDVLSHGPLDLLFVEFAVNDDQDAQQDYEDALRGMEGIIAQARRHNPKVDIVMTFFVNENILRKLQRGESTPSIEAHSQVAEHYGVSVNHLAQELADLITAGKMDWKKFGGVHPNEYGNTMCATMIRRALLQQWAKPLSADAQAQPYALPDVIDAKSYIHGRFLPLDALQMDANWTVGVPNWPEENAGAVRSRFKEVPMIYSSQAHAKLTIDFEGTAIGAYMLAGPDAGILRCTVDGEQSQEIDTLHRYSGFNYPMTVMFFNELAPGSHSLEIEILDNRPGPIKAGGTALRVIDFVAN